MSALRPATAETVDHAQRAAACLSEALMHAKAAGSPRTAERIRAAIKSADGALRHAQRRASPQASADEVSK